MRLQAWLFIQGLVLSPHNTPPGPPAEMGVLFDMASSMPRTDAEIGPWVTNLEAKAAANPTDYGVTAGDVVPLTEALATWNTDYPAHIAEQAAAVLKQRTKDATRMTMDSDVRTLVRKMQGSGQVTPAKAGDLGIHARDTEPTPVGPPVDTPLIMLDFHNRGQIIVHFGPNPGNEHLNGLPKGSAGALIQVVEGGPPANEADWRWLANDSASPYVHMIGGTAPRTFTYRCAYVNRRNQQGPFSAPETATSTP